MPQISWTATPNGFYWIDVSLGQHDCRCMIDLGLVDPLDLIGFSVAPTFYDTLKHAGLLVGPYWRKYRDANGVFVKAESGLTTARLVDLVNRQSVGPAVQIQVSKGAPG